MRRLEKYMTQETQKNNSILIIVAIVGVIGTIIATTITVMGNYNIEKLRQETELTRMAATQNGVTQAGVQKPADKPLPPTPTQTAQSLLPSFTPTNTAIILFTDTFDSNQNGWVIGNLERTYSKQSRTISDGIFEFGALFTRDDGFAWANAQNLRVKNFNMSVEAEVVQNSINSRADIIIAFRYGNQGRTTYVVAFGSDSSFSFYSSNDDRWNLIYQGKSNAFQVKEGIKNTFGVRAIEQKFTIFANGQELHTSEDSSFNYEGEIGIGVKGNIGKSILVRFDNLVVTEAP
jgi:hypothetical protein